MAEASGEMTRFERIAWFIGETARPFLIHEVGIATAIGIVIVASKVSEGSDGAIFLGAVGVIVGLVVGAKAVENINAARQTAKVETAKVSSGTNITVETDNVEVNQK